MQRDLFFLNKGRAADILLAHAKFVVGHGVALRLHPRWSLDPNEKGVPKTHNSIHIGSTDILSVFLGAYYYDTKSKTGEWHITVRLRDSVLHTSITEREDEERRAMYEYYQESLEVFADKFSGILIPLYTKHNPYRHTEGGVVDNPVEGDTGVTLYFNDIPPRQYRFVLL